MISVMLILCCGPHDAQRSQLPRDLPDNPMRGLL
jgi:hypothetical protein